MDRQHSSSSPVIVDIQCFSDNNRSYILKEVCVLEVDTGVLLMHHVARPPYHRSELTPRRLRGNNWLTRNFHGLAWDQGDISYCELCIKLTECISQRSTVYVKGLEKKVYLKQSHVKDRLATNVVDICGMSPLSSLYKRLADNVHPRCSNHNSVFSRCALTNCIAVRTWLLEERRRDEADVRTDASYFCSCFRTTTTTSTTAASAGYDTVDGGDLQDGHSAD